MTNPPSPLPCPRCRTLLLAPASASRVRSSRTIHDLDQRGEGSRSRAITVKDLGSLRLMSTLRHIFPTSVKPEPLSRLFADEFLERRVESARRLHDPTA